MDQATATASQWTPAVDQTTWVAPRASHSSSADNDFQAALDQTVTNQTDQSQADQYSEEGLLPVEAFALPDWYAAYIPQQCVLSASINHAYWDQVEQYASDGIMTKQEESAMLAMLHSDPVRAKELANEDWRREHSQELSEYFDILHNSLVESLREHGIEGAVDYYHSVIQDPATSEQVRQSFQERLDGQPPRFQELMEELGVQV